MKNCDVSAVLSSGFASAWNFFSKSVQLNWEFRNPNSFLETFADLGRFRGLNHIGKKSLSVFFDMLMTHHISGYDSFFSQCMSIYIYTRLRNLRFLPISNPQLFWWKKNIHHNQTLDLGCSFLAKRDPGGRNFSPRQAQKKEGCKTTVKNGRIWEIYSEMSFILCPFFENSRKFLQVAFLGSNSFVSIPSLYPFGPALVVPPPPEQVMGYHIDRSDVSPLNLWSSKKCLPMKSQKLNLK